MWTEVSVEMEEGEEDKKDLKQKVRTGAGEGELEGEWGRFRFSEKRKFLLTQAKQVTYVSRCVSVHVSTCVGKHDHALLNSILFLNRLPCIGSQLPKLTDAGKPGSCSIKLESYPTPLSVLFPLNHNHLSSLPVWASHLPAFQSITDETCPQPGENRMALVNGIIRGSWL